MKFKVSKEFFDKVPNAYFAVVCVKGFDNNKELSFTGKMLEEASSKARELIGDSKVKENELIIPYRDAFRNLGINPNKYMCSIEALMTRLSKGNEIPHINPIVDLCNALSIKYVLPVGVHDVDNFKGDLEIRPANSSDEFIPFGSSDIEKVDEGEMVYVSLNEVKTRRWTWRQGEASKVTNNTSNIFIPIDGFSDINKDKVIMLQEELIKILDSLGYITKKGYVDKETPEFIIED